MRIKELRLAKGISQKDLAKFFCVPSNTFNQWENGKREPDNEMIIRLADYFGVTIDELFGRDLKEKQKEPDAMTRAELDDELFKLLISVPSDQVQRVKDFVAGMVAAREKPHSDDSDETNEQRKSSPHPTKN